MLFTAQDVLPCYHECITNVLLFELESVCQNSSLFYMRSLKPFINLAQIYWDTYMSKFKHPSQVCYPAEFHNKLKRSAENSFLVA